MFAVVVHERERAAWRQAFATHDITIGTADENDLVLGPGQGIAARHGRIVHQAGHYILVDFGAGASFVDGKRIEAPQVVREGEVVLLGDVRLEIVTLAYDEIGAQRVVARDHVEHALLEAIGQGDAASRQVYADWLEANGDPDRAELVRTQLAAGSASRGRVQELAAALDLATRARLLALPIENCAPSFRFECPQQWSALLLTAVEGERFCDPCEQTVYFCATIDEARKRAGECVAIDVASPRWEGDLDPPFGDRVCLACDLDLGPNLRVCPRCGERPPVEHVIMGEHA